MAAPIDARSLPLVVLLVAACESGSSTASSTQSTPCTGTASIGDFVWADLNCNGLQDAGEPGLDGVPIQLTDNRGTVRTTTTVNGAYVFDQLCAGAYTVTVDETNLVPNYAMTLCDVGPDDTLDSECSPTTVVLSSDDTVDTSIDFGYCPIGLGSIGDLVWHDLDGDGLQAPGEPGIPGVRLALLDPANTTPPLETTCTDANGRYRFDLLPPADYLIEAADASLTVTACFVASPCNVGDDDELDSNCGPAFVRLSAGEVNDSIDFGYTRFGSGAIGDFVWNDLNADGIQDAGEPGLELARVSLFDDTGALYCEQRTGPDGAYLFESLCAGDYDIVVDVSQAGAGFVRSPCEVGVNPAIDSNCLPARVTLPFDDSEDRSIDFGFYVPVP